MVPQTSERRPSTGRVVSIGEEVTRFGVGDGVLYSNFAGHTVEFPDQVLRILHQKEILSKVKGHLEMSRIRNQKEALGI